MSDDLERRVRQVRSRVAVRAWEYRQRHHAKGVWMRLRRILADAAAAYVIPESEAERLVAEGFPPEPVGRELEPAKVILFLPAERVARLAGAREIPVRLEVELLEAPALALVRFP
ncbi:MAG TPA: hypothetical protein VGW35_18520 [Methylomirabilota bacterium]|nr:hypothetical protein [Methylomirabilota bacterium]